MQVVHPMLTTFHCVPYLMKFKQRENGPDLLNEMQANGKRTRTLCPSKNPYLLKIEKLSQISTFGEGQYQETSPSSAIYLKKFHILVTSNTRHCWWIVLIDPLVSSFQLKIDFFRHIEINPDSDMDFQPFHLFQPE